MGAIKEAKIGTVESRNNSLLFNLGFTLIFENLSTKWFDSDAISLDAIVTSHRKILKLQNMLNILKQVYMHEIDQESSKISLVVKSFENAFKLNERKSVSFTGDYV